MVVCVRYHDGAFAQIDLGEGSRIVRFEEFASTDGRVIDPDGAKRGLVISKPLDVKRFQKGEPSYVGKPEQMLLVHDSADYDEWLKATVDEIYLDGIRFWVSR